jgi:histidinol-phosphate aminotransferase
VPDHEESPPSLLRGLFFEWKKSHMSQYWSPIVKQLKPYTPGEQPKIDRLIKLNTNENPYGPSPLAIEAMQLALGDGLHLYPDPNAEQLKCAIAEQHAQHGITSAHVFVGNGSDEVLAHAFNALLQHENPVLFPDISYSFYQSYCSLYQIDYLTVPLAADFAIRIDDYIGRRNGGIVLCNPNAPTGCLLALSEVERMVAGHPGSVILVDEAYIDFGGTSAIELVAAYPNLLVVQTLSKSRSLAGLRVGFAIGHPDLIDAMERVKNSFNSYPLDRIALAGATAAMRDVMHFQRTTQAVIASRALLTAGLAQLDFDVLPSAANFVFARHPRHEARGIAATLRANGILVRHFEGDRIADFLRISVGTDAAGSVLLDVLGDALA